MALRTSTLGVVFSVAAGMLVACAGLLGIEDATCDPRFDSRCATLGTLQPAGSGGTGVAGAPGTGGAGGGRAGRAGASGSTQVVDEPEPPEEPLCDRYCDTLAEACPTPYEQYASPEACRAVCAKLDPGLPGDDVRLANTIECRLARAELARRTGEANLYCYSAGPGGSGFCGSNCEGFCTIMAKTCSLMGSFAECMPQCELIPDLSDSPDNITYDVSIREGDSMQCRLYHVSAATIDSRTHCGHAAGSTPCAATSSSDVP